MQTRSWKKCLQQRSNGVSDTFLNVTVNEFTIIVKTDHLHFIKNFRWKTNNLPKSGLQTGSRRSESVKTSPWTALKWFWFSCKYNCCYFYSIRVFFNKILIQKRRIFIISNQLQKNYYAVLMHIFARDCFAWFLGSGYPWRLCSMVLYQIGYQNLVTKIVVTNIRHRESYPIAVTKIVVAFKILVKFFNHYFKWLNSLSHGNFFRWSILKSKILHFQNFQNYERQNDEIFSADGHWQLWFSWWCHAEDLSVSNFMNHDSNFEFQGKRYFFQIFVDDS